MSTPEHQAVLLFLHASDQLVGGTTIQKMVEVGARTWKTGTYFETRVLPDPIDTQFVAQVVCDVIAQSIEDTLDGPFITEMSYFQDTTQGGQLLDMMQVFWATPDETAEGWINLILAKIEPQLVNPCIQNAVANYKGEPEPYPNADCSPTGFAAGTGPIVPPGGIPHQ